MWVRRIRNLSIIVFIFFLGTGFGKYIATKQLENRALVMEKGLELSIKTAELAVDRLVLEKKYNQYYVDAVLKLIEHPLNDDVFSAYICFDLAEKLGNKGITDQDLGPYKDLYERKTPGSFNFPIDSINLLMDIDSSYD